MYCTPQKDALKQHGFVAEPGLAQTQPFAAHHALHAFVAWAES